MFLVLTIVLSCKKHHDKPIENFKFDTPAYQGKKDMKGASEKKRIAFYNANGERLSARIERPVHTHPKAYALFAHCFTCNKNLHAVKNISRALTKAGFAVMRFDFTGLGESEGEIKGD